MSKLTLDEAIKHYLKVAEEEEYSAIMFKQKKEASAFLEKALAEKAENDCQESAAEHRQLAEWLTELKEAKRLLKAAVKDINFYVDCFEAQAQCDECCCDHDNHCHWKHEAEALKLIES